MSAALGTTLAAGDFEVLGQARFLSSLDRGQLARVAKLARVERYPADTRIY